MEEALIEMKKRNDELIRGNKDAIDSPSPNFYSTNDEVMHLKEELKRREAAHTERIVEMVRDKSVSLRKRIACIWLCEEKTTFNHFFPRRSQEWKF